MRESQAKPAGSATLTYQNKQFELPVFSGTTGPNVVDIRKLYTEADIFTYDPGFTSTASCESDSHRLIAKIPIITAMAFKYAVGQPFLYPLNNLCYTENLMRITFSVPAE